MNGVKKMADEVADFDHNDAAMQDFDALSELDSLFEEDERLKQAENNVLTQNLTGFANCFPDWDLHPPVA